MVSAKQQTLLMGMQPHAQSHSCSLMLHHILGPLPHPPISPPIHPCRIPIDSLPPLFIIQPGAAPSFRAAKLYLSLIAYRLRHFPLSDPSQCHSSLAPVAPV